jgi:signal peptidase I
MRSDLLEYVKNALFLDLLRESGRARLRVAGNSMLPTLRVGDMIVVEALRDTTMRPAEIVVFVQNGIFCTHRVFKSCGSNVITRGDANRHLDFPVSKLECLARVVAIERKGAKITALSPRPALSFVMRYSNLARTLFLWMTRNRGARSVPESAVVTNSW